MRAASPLGGDEPAGEYAAGRGDFGGGVSVDVDVETGVTVVEEELP